MKFKVTIERDEEVAWHAKPRAQMDGFSLVIPAKAGIQDLDPGSSPG